MSKVCSRSRILVKYPVLGFLSKYSRRGFVIRDPHSKGEQALRAFLRERRKSASLRQADLAERLNVPQSFVSKYESGERLLTFLEVLTILRELEVSVDEVIACLPSIKNETKS
ncbi:MAG: helix-turn-helix transcriptional regulator [Blastochloris sp.]|nr:helix-turn-helix transcriptional regulator [Blastochloris sp.]